MQATANIGGSICGTFCGLGLIFIIIGILVVVAFFAGAIYLTYWIYKRAVETVYWKLKKRKKRNTNRNVASIYHNYNHNRKKYLPESGKDIIVSLIHKLFISKHLK